MEYHLSHAMILEGPDPEANLALAKKLAQQAVCTAGGRRPCGVCRDCVKAAGGESQVTASQAAGYLAQRLTRKKLMALLEAVLEAQAMLERNVNQTLLAAWMCAKLK